MPFQRSSASLYAIVTWGLTVLAKAWVLLKILDTPKSPIFKMPPSDMKTFWGFKSLEKKVHITIGHLIFRRTVICVTG